MAKNKNALGICVLPVPKDIDPISWDEYKDRYGVDLEKIFMVDFVDPHYVVKFQPSFTKIVALAPVAEYLEPGDVTPPSIIVSFKLVTDASEDLDASILSLKFYDSGTGLTLSLMIYGDKKVIGEFA